MEKERYLTPFDLQVLLNYMEEIKDYCREKDNEGIERVLEDAYANYGVVLELDPENCNVFLKLNFNL